MVRKDHHGIYEQKHIGVSTYIIADCKAPSRYGQRFPCYGVVMPMGTNRYGPTARYG